MGEYKERLIELLGDTDEATTKRLEDVHADLQRQGLTVDQGVATGKITASEASVLRQFIGLRALALVEFFTESSAEATEVTVE